MQFADAPKISISKRCQSRPLMGLFAIGQLTYVKKKATLALEVAVFSCFEYPRSVVKLNSTAMSIIEIARPKDPHIIGCCTS